MDLPGATSSYNKPMNTTRLPTSPSLLHSSDHFPLGLRNKRRVSNHWQNDGDLLRTCTTDLMLRKTDSSIWILISSSLSAL